MTEKEGYEICEHVQEISRKRKSDIEDWIHAIEIKHRKALYADLLREIEADAQFCNEITIAYSPELHEMFKEDGFELELDDTCDPTEIIIKWN